MSEAERADAAELALAFFELRPGAAAQVLEGLPAEEAVDALSQAPARLAAPVLATMVSGPAVRCLTVAGQDPAAAWLRAMDEGDAIRLLRQLPAARCEALLVELSARTARRLRAALRYHESLVGAWIDPGAATVPVERSVGQCLRAFRSPDATTSQLVMLVAANGRFVGAAPVERLVCARDDTPVAELVDRALVPLSVRASIVVAAGHEGWRRYGVLPVSSADQSFRGALTRASLDKAIESRRGAATLARSPATITGELAGAFLAALGGVARSLAAGDSHPRERDARERDASAFSGTRR
ncbi:MAG: hypothetical protein KJZ83_06075 [Burkholderiaceae bacterium]|nr:hypothetical protein [Burkholderiaceae bacterium]